ncbi:N-acetylglucosaminyltransferase-like protein [Dissophora ornata]|nr:N-acetylglucosaminyltransferase-like protein [Dissophora ornata]
MSARIPRRCRVILIAFTIASSCSFLFLFVFPYFFIDLSYLSRPLWDKPAAQWDEIIVHKYAEGMTMKDRCKAHNWTLRPESTPTPTLYDAVIFSVELDMLEIRIREMWDVVDKFVILEANATFTGHSKEETFKNNRDRFAFAESKILYKSIPLWPLKSGETPWKNEKDMRRGMDVFLIESRIQPADLVTFSDVDEIISREAIELLKSCEGIPQSIHLHLKNYLYSYEFPVADGGMWRPSLHRWPPGKISYDHGQSSNILFYDAGWHCSFCFRTIKDFQFKMKAYSHADRIRYNYLMDRTWIQEAICEGKDLFGMFPEAYSFRELFGRLGAIPKSYSAVGLPKWVLENREWFKFLLPGGCQRED